MASAAAIQLSEFTLPGPDLNPYASPTAASVEISGNEALRYLRWPALGLLVVSGSWSAIGLALIAFFAGVLLWEMVTDREVAAALLRQIGTSDVVVAAILLLNLWISVCSWRMRSGRGFGFAVAAAIAACIPLLSPWYLLGIPFGIWTLIVLCRRDVRAAFRAAGAAARRASPRYDIQ